MAGRVRVGTAYIDIKLGSFTEFQEAAERRAKETAARIAARMSEDISKKVSGDEAGEKIGNDAAEGVDRSLNRGGGLRAVFNKALDAIPEQAKNVGRKIGDALERPLESVTRNFGNLRSEIARVSPAVLSMAENGRAAFSKMGSALSEASSHAESFGRKIGLASYMVSNLGLQLSILTAAVTAVGLAFGFFGVKFGMELEQVTVGMATFLGSMSAARKEVELLGKIAQQSPAFDTITVIGFAKQLLGAGIAVDKVNALVTSSGRIFTAYGLSVEQSQRALLGIQQIIQKGKLSMEELRGQVGEQIPVFALLAEHYGVTQEKLLEMIDTGKIGAKEFQEAMIAIGNSRKFLDGNTASANTLSGKLTALKETVQFKLATAFEKHLFPTLGLLIDKYAPKIMESLDNMGPTLDRVARRILDTDAALNRIKDRWDDMSPGMKDFIKDLTQLILVAGPVILVLSKVSSTIGVLATVAGLIATPVGLAAVAVAALGVAIFSLRAPLQEYFTKTKEGQTATDNLKKSWEGIQVFIDEKLLPAFKNVSDKVGQALTGFVTADSDAGGIIGFFGRIRDLADSLGKSFRDSLQPAIDNFKGAMKNLGIDLDSGEKKINVLKVAITGIVAVISFVIAVMIGLGSFIINLVAGLIRSVTSLVSGVWQVIVGIGKIFQGIFESDWDRFVEGIKDVWNGLWKAIVGTIWDAITGVVNAVIGFVMPIYNWFVWLWDELVGHSVVPDMINSIVAWFKSLPGKVIGGIASFVSSVATKFTEMKDKAVQAVSDLPGKIGDKITETKNKIISAASGFANILYNSGRDLIQGFLNGINSRAGAVIDKARDLAGSVKDTIHNALDFGSPSKVMMQYGVWTAEGLAIGMDKGVPDVTASANHLATAAIPNITPGYSLTNAVNGGVIQGSNNNQNIEVNVNVPGPVERPEDIADYTVRRLVSALATGAPN